VKIDVTTAHGVRHHERPRRSLYPAFDGPSGTRDAYASGLMNKVDCCYPGGKGQELIAALLLRTGLAPSH
jgi:hypothetical protein